MTDWLERRREILRDPAGEVQKLLEENRRLRQDRDGLVEFTVQYMVGAGVCRERAKTRVKAFVDDTFDWDAYKQDTGYRSPHENDVED